MKEEAQKIDYSINFGPFAFVFVVYRPNHSTPDDLESLDGSLELVEALYNANLV